MGSFNGGRVHRRAAPAAAAGRAPADRTKLIRAIHAAARASGLDDEERRDVQVGAVGKESLTEMDAGELAAVLARLNRSSRPANDRPHVGKVRALWWTLYWLGAVDDHNSRALDAFVRRQTGIAALRFLDHRQAHSVIDALKDWAAREGVRWPVKSDRRDDRRAVLAAIADKLGRALGEDVEQHAPDFAHELDAAIRQLGKQLRRALGKAA